MNLPSDFLSLMCQQLGEAPAKVLCDALCSTEPSVSVRLNPWKGVEVRAALSAASSPSAVSSLSAPVPWCPDAYYLPERPAFTFDPQLHAGAYYVQEASSMFLAQAIIRYMSSASVVLDLCAAPGGKSTLLRTLLPDGALLVSNEPVARRAQVLAENMTKWGHPSTLVTQNFPADFSPLRHVFDVIVADVPCSGEGMFRKDAEAVGEWSMQNVLMCQERQRSILADVWPALKPGGLLVYSTCTFNRFEDEDNVDWICRELGAEVLDIPCDEAWGVTGHYHFLPGTTRGEGFFLSLLRKSDGEPLQPAAAVRERRPKPGREPAFPAALRSWVRGEFDFLVESDTAIAFPSSHALLRPLLRRHLHVLAEGVCLAELKGRDWQPAHSLAMSSALVRGTFPEAVLTYDEALAYLRREAVSVSAPRGHVLVTFRGLPLGFVKNLGSRANNLYPAEWRIRSGFTTPFVLSVSV